MNITFSDPALIEAIANSSNVNVLAESSSLKTEPSAEGSLFEDILTLFSDFKSDNNPDQLTDDLSVTTGIISEDELAKSNEATSLEVAEDTDLENQTGSVTLKNNLQFFANDGVDLIKNGPREKLATPNPVILTNVEVKNVELTQINPSESNPSPVNPDTPNVQPKLQFSNPLKITPKLDETPEINEQISNSQIIATEQKLTPLHNFEDLNSKVSTGVYQITNYFLPPENIKATSSQINSATPLSNQLTDDEPSKELLELNTIKSNEHNKNTNNLSPQLGTIKTPNSTNITSNNFAIPEGKSLEQDFSKVENTVFAVKEFDNNMQEEILTPNPAMIKESESIIKNNATSPFQSNIFRANKLDNSISEQIGFKAIKSINSNNKIITFELEPASLGKIEIKFEESIGKNPTTTLKILTEKFTTFDTVSRSIPNIENILRDTGIKGEINIEMGLKDFNTPNFARNNQHGDVELNTARNSEPTTESQGILEIEHPQYNGQLNIYI